MELLKALGVRTFLYKSTDLSVQEYGCFHTEIRTFSYSYPRIHNIYTANLLMADFIDFFYVTNPTIVSYQFLQILYTEYINAKYMIDITNSGIKVRKCSYFCMKTSVLLYKNVRTPRAFNSSINLQHFEVLYELYGLEYEQRDKSRSCSPVSTEIQLFFLQCFLCLSVKFHYRLHTIDY